MLRIVKADAKPFVTDSGDLLYGADNFIEIKKGWRPENIGEIIHTYCQSKWCIRKDRSEDYVYCHYCENDERYAVESIVSATIKALVKL
jgi:hypothetical protein